MDAPLFWFLAVVNSGVLIGAAIIAYLDDDFSFRDVLRAFVFVNGAAVIFFALFVTIAKLI